MNIDNGLLGFLQRKSLFQTDYKQPNRNKINSRSSDNKDSSLSKTNYSPIENNDAIRSFFSPTPRLHSTMNQQAPAKSNISVFSTYPNQKKTQSSVSYP